MYTGWAKYESLDFLVCRRAESLLTFSQGDLQPTSWARQSFPYSALWLSSAPTGALTPAGTLAWRRRTPREQRRPRAMWRRRLPAAACGPARPPWPAGSQSGRAWPCCRGRRRRRRGQCRRRWGWWSGCWTRWRWARRTGRVWRCWRRCGEGRGPCCDTAVMNPPLIHRSVIQSICDTA